VPDGTTYYHELDNTFYTATSSTFFGQIYGMFGLENIADSADDDGSAFGYPQLSSEYIVSADPDLIFLADVLYGESAETVAARPGWDVLTAVRQGNVVELDSDIASRWGPRIVDFAQLVADAVEEFVSRG
jgi:iron complex transport system substrate-binding protein